MTSLGVDSFKSGIFVIRSNDNTAQNLSASRSRVLDTDYAAESAALAKSSVLQQASSSMLAQANQQPQIALSTESQKKKIYSNRHDILLDQRQNTTKPFPHILGRRKEKPSGLFHKIQTNLVP